MKSSPLSQTRDLQKLHLHQQFNINININTRLRLQSTMAITIVPPASGDEVYPEHDSSPVDTGDDDSSDVGRPLKRRKVPSKHIVIPGETITSETQWMRLVHSSLNVIRAKSKRFLAEVMAHITPPAIPSSTPPSLALSSKLTSSYPSSHCAHAIRPKSATLSSAV